ncbi:unnamed protein product [Closterium sp. Naga37s-1]|nr:unnamed protein product [Closterium sp. Naga37s-1]
MPIAAELVSAPLSAKSGGAEEALQSPDNLAIPAKGGLEDAEAAVAAVDRCVLSYVGWVLADSERWVFAGVADTVEGRRHTARRLALLSCSAHGRSLGKKAWGGKGGKRGGGKQRAAAAVGGVRSAAPRQGAQRRRRRLLHPRWRCRWSVLPLSRSRSHYLLTPLHESIPQFFMLFLPIRSPLPPSHPHSPLSPRSFPFSTHTPLRRAGVADGVGGWAEIGVDAGLYARELMGHVQRAVEDEPKGGADPMRVLERAHSSTASYGSSTACVAVLQADQLQAANLGDSGFLIIRHGHAIFKSPSQQHDFNFPFQLGSEGGDSPLSADVYSLPVAPGDVVVMGTDGLFDNVFDNEVSSLVSHALLRGLSPQSTAEHLAALARDRALDRFRLSPFARAAQEAGYRYIGGKLDDITVVVSYVTEGK